MVLKLSVLDQSPIVSGFTPVDAIRETIELAQACERLGYHRYWVAEHHNWKGLAGSSPEIMIAHVAHHTSRMRIGSGGVMLSHYPALKVAENFKMLEAMFPGRIDLGIGRAPGGDFAATLALNDGEYRDMNNFTEKLDDLMGFLHDELPAGHRYERVEAVPAGVGVPEVWMLGSSDRSALHAAELGAAFSFAHFLNPYNGGEVIQMYRERFRPSPEMPEPLASAAIFVMCAETQEEAERMVVCRDLSMLRMEKGQVDLYPTIEQAMAYPYTDMDRLAIRRNRTRVIYGDQASVKQQLLRIQEAYQLDEIVIVTITHSAASRLRSYELIAEAFELTSMVR